MKNRTTNQRPSDELSIPEVFLKDLGGFAHDALIAVLNIQYFASSGHRDNAGSLAEQVMPHAIAAATLLGDHDQMLARYTAEARRARHEDERSSDPLGSDEQPSPQGDTDDGVHSRAAVADTLDGLADELRSLEEYARKAMDVCVASQVMHAREGAKAATYWRAQGVQWDDEQLEGGVMAARMLATRVKTLADDVDYQAHRLRHRS